MNTYIDLQQLLQKAQATKDSIAIDALASCVLFPKTSSLEEDQPIRVYQIEKGQNLDDIMYDDIIKKIEYDEEFIAINAVKDIKIIVKLLKQVHQGLHLQQFASIQIYRSGINLLRINNNNRQGVNRSAYIEINEYRRRLLAILSPNQNNTHEILIYSMAIIVGIQLIYNIANKFLAWK